MFHKIKNGLSTLRSQRLVQLISAALAMMMISNLQYSWTLFTSPLSEHLNLSIVSIQYAFTLFVMFQTFIQPLSGYLVDKYGYRLIFIVGGLLAGCGWYLMGQVTSLVSLYVFYSMAGIGAAIIYGGSVSIALLWYPDRRGVASGVIVGAFGLGSIPFIPIISQILDQQGISTAFQFIGILQILVLLGVAFILRAPSSTEIANKKSLVKSKTTSTVNFHPLEILKTPHFWLMWTMFFSVNVGGLIITANAKSFGKSLEILPSIIVISVMINSFANGLSRVFWGWVSDHFGRTKVMFVSFGLNAFFLFMLPIVGSRGDVFYVLSLMFVMFTWGQLFSLFPSMNADLFGTKYASSNNGLLTSAKGIAAILGGGLGAYLANTYGWNIVFTVAALMSLYASLMSLVLPRLPKPVQRS